MMNDDLTRNKLGDHCVESVKRGVQQNEPILLIIEPRNKYISNKRR